MSITYVLLSGIFYLIPGMAETFYRYSENYGNMGYTGIFLDIKNRRNLVYICSLSSFSLIFTSFKIFGVLSNISLLFSLYLYFSTIKKWHPYVS